MLVILFGGLVALLSGGSTSQRRLPVAAGVAAALVPVVIGGGNLLLRFMLGMTAALIVFRSVDLARFGAQMTFGHRLWHVFAIFDTRKIARRTPQLDVRASLAALAWAALAGLGFAAGMRWGVSLDGPARWIVRWLAAAVFAVAAVEVLCCVVTSGYAMLGIRPPPLHDAPYLSRSVSEFWGARWNKVVSGWLRENCFKPLARRRSPRMGLVAAFFASAFLHWYLTYISAGWWWSIPMASFFLIQLALIAAERALGVARWHPAAARAWTLVALIGVSPLFSEPMLALLE